MDRKVEKIVEKRYCRKKASYVNIEKLVTKISMTDEEKRQLKDKHLTETINEPKFKFVQCLDAEDDCTLCALKSIDSYNTYNRSLMERYSTEYSPYSNNGYKEIVLTDYTTDAN